MSLPIHKILMWIYKKDIKQVSSGSTNYNFFGYFCTHIIKIWPNLFKFQSMPILAIHLKQMTGTTLGARDFSSAVSGFCEVFSRGFGLGPKMCRPSADTENSRRTREKPLVPRVDWNQFQNMNIVFNNKTGR